MLKVLKGIIDPQDPDQKSARRGILLGYKEGGAIFVAPCTTYFERTGRVPPGHVLLNEKNCPSFSKTGFDKREILINIRDAFCAAPNSKWVAAAEEVGFLDLKSAPRVRDLIGQCLREFPPRAMVYQ